MKICKKCNLSYDDNKKFCKKCGSALVTDYRIESMADAKKTILEDRLKADPLNVELLHEYAQFLFNNSILKETISVSLKLRVIDEKDTFAKELLYKSYFKLNMLIEAMEYGKLLLSERPNDISLLQELAEIACKMENAELETEFYNQILEIDPTHVDALLNKAHCFLKESQLEKAVSIFGNLWDDVNTKDRVIKIYAGIDKTLKSDYAGAIKLLRPILSEDDLVKKNDIDTNRGILYLTYSLCQNEEKLAEIKRWAIKVNYDNLERNHHPLDEKIAFSIAELIINRSLNEVLSSNEVKKQIADLTLFIPESTYSRNSDLKIAEIWFAVGLKQEKFKLLKDATKSFSKAVVLAPGDNRYKEKLIETEKLLERHTRKRNKKIIFSIVTSFVSLLVIISSIFFIKYYAEIKAFEIAKKTNTSDSYSFYLNEYPNGLFHNKAQQLKEPAAWEYAKELNTVKGYDLFLDHYPNSKYSKDLPVLRENALWKVAQSSGNFYDYIRQYPTGKYIEDIKFNIPNSSKIKKDLIGHSISIGNRRSVRWNFDNLNEFKNFTIHSSKRAGTNLEFVIVMDLYSYSSNNSYNAKILVTYSLTGSGWVFNNTRSQGPVDKFVGVWTVDNYPIIEIKIIDEDKILIRQCYGIDAEEGVEFWGYYNNNEIIAKGNAQDFYKFQIPTFKLLGNGNLYYDCSVGPYELKKSNIIMPEIRFLAPVNND